MIHYRMSQFSIHGVMPYPLCEKLRSKLTLSLPVTVFESLTQA